MLGDDFLEGESALVAFPSLSLGGEGVEGGGGGERAIEVEGAVGEVRCVCVLSLCPLSVTVNCVPVIFLCVCVCVCVCVCREVAVS